MVAKGTSKRMSKKLTILLLTLAVLISLSVGYVLIGLQAYAHYQWNSQANQEHCGGQPPVRICVQAPTAIFSAFYPSYVANHNNQFVIKYSSSSPVTLLINVDIPGFTRVQTRTVNASPTLQSISFTPPLLDHALRNFTAEDNTSLHV